MRRPWEGIAFSFLLPLAGFAVFPLLEEQFFPAAGRDQFHVTIEGPVTDSIAKTRATAAIVDRLAREGGAIRVDWFFGASAPQFYYNVIASRQGTPNYAQAVVRIPPGRDPQPRIAALQRRVNREVASSRVLVKQLEQGPPFASPIEVRLFGPDLEVLDRLGEEVRVILSAMPEVTSVRSDLADVLPEIGFDIDAASAVQSALEDRLAGFVDRLPVGYQLQYGGEASKRDDAVGNLFSTVGVLAVLMLATLVLSFGSFRMAGIIAIVAVLSVGLGTLALALSGYPFGFMAIIGTMGLIGVAINDSIVVLAGIRANPIAAGGDVEAIVGEVMHSSRHVVATTLTTIAGGVAGATVLALVFVPSIYRALRIR